MKENYTSAEARALLHVDAKTFLRWLAQGNITPQVSKRDHRVKVFTGEQIAQIADEHDRLFDEASILRTLQDEGTIISSPSDERIAQLEERIGALERRIGALEVMRQSSPRTPRATQIAPTSSTLPEGLIDIDTLIKRHGLERQRKTIVRHMESFLQRGDWIVNGHSRKLALDAKGQAEFIKRYG